MIEMADENQQMMQQQSQMSQQMQSPQMQAMQPQHQQPSPQQAPPQQQQSQQQQAQPQSQQQAVAVTMSLPNAMDQANALNQPNTMAINAAMAVSQPQTMAGAGQVSVNDSAGNPVHMTVPQLTAPPPQTSVPTAVMSQSSGPHPTMLHPAMSMAQSPLQQVQVIQQPLSASYLQQLYTPQQQMLFPGNLTLQHGMGAPTLQSLGAAQGLSLQLQTKSNMDPKTSVAGQTLQAVNNKGISFTTSNMMTAAGQVLGPGAKANFQQQVMAGPGKQIIHGQAQFAPGNANQTVVIGQLGVLPNQQSVFNQKALADSQKKTYMVNQQATLQPKAPIFSSSIPPHSSAQVFNGNQLKQLTSTPQLITSQAAGFSQAQLLGSLQALGASLPQGLSWTTQGLQSPALLTQNPIFIRSQQSDMFIQSQPQAAVHLPVAAASAPLPPTSYATATLTPQKTKQVRVRPGSSVATQTVVSTVATIQANTPPLRTQVHPGSSVATQTVVSSVATVQANTPPFRTQVRARAKTISNHLTSPNIQTAQPIATAQTQTNQALRQLMPPPSMPQQLAQQKSDASNQTKPVPEMKSTSTQSKSVGVDAKELSPPAAKSQAKVAPSTKVATKTTASMPAIATVTSIATATVTDSSTSMVLPAMTVSPSINLDKPEVCNQMMPVMNLQDSPLEHSLPQAEIKPLPESSHEVRPLPNTMKDRHPQKAIVKPHVLTHVIDGYIIQEGPEPFPVSRSSLLTDLNMAKPTQVEAPSGPVERTRVVDSEKKKKIHRVRGPVELAKCEFCGKLGAKSKFKKSKRFCSTSCAKRYNVAPPEQESVTDGGRKRRRMAFKMRKGIRKAEGGRLAYNTTDWEPEQQESESPESMEENIISRDHKPSMEDEASPELMVETESPVPAIVVLPQKESMEIDPPEAVAHPSMKSFNKWTVNEVFEFIRDLAGCSDYADEFRSQEIDGQALLLLKADHLMSAMGMKLGPALKLIARIDSIKEEMAHS